MLMSGRLFVNALPRVLNRVILSPVFTLKFAIYQKDSTFGMCFFHKY